MSMQIKSIILYNGKQEKPRQLNFKLGTVNIITGSSNTGKSTIIPIIHYCLGYSELGLPIESRTRKTVSWYAVLYQLGDKEILVAKPAPAGNSNRQNHVYYQIGQKISIPSYHEISVLKPQWRDYQLIDEISQLLRDTLGLEVLSLTESEKLKTTIEYTYFYLFQSKTIIANNEILFYNQRNKQKDIQTTLPYFLGVESEYELKLKDKIEELIKNFNNIREKQRKSKHSFQHNQDRAKELFLQGKTLGLLDNSLFSDNFHEINNILKALLQKWQPTFTPPDEEDIEPQLKTELENLEQKLRKKRQEIENVNSFIEESNAYTQHAEDHYNRLESIKLFDISQSNLFQETCPLCHSPLKENTIPEVLSILQVFKQLDRDLNSVKKEEKQWHVTRNRLTEESEHIRTEVKKKKSELGKIIKENEKNRNLIQNIINNNHQASRLMGNIEEYFRTIDTTPDLTHLEKEEKQLKDQLDNNKKQLKEIESNLAASLDIISKQMTEWAEKIDLEWQDAFYRFDLKNQTVSVSWDNRSNPMDSFSGGLTLLGCHLITLFALHKHFILHKRPVPSFLILDQPIQGYLSQNSERDNEKVKLILNLISEVCSELSPNFQIILTEHDLLDGTEFYRIEPHWTEEKGLIPFSW